MAKSKTQKRCFIIMPITTPTNFVESYKGDPDHFTHVLDYLFVPALKEAGFEPISPKAQGSNIIHADIIKRLSECELVLCDMSILNPNVFFEFGIRTALDKPVALVVDNKTKPIPFDTGIINFHPYESSLDAWTLEEQKKLLTKHVQEAYKKSKDHNALWKYFGVAQTGTFKPEQAEVGDKIDFVMNKISAIETQLKNQQESEWSKRLGGYGGYGSFAGMSDPRILVGPETPWGIPLSPNALNDIPNDIPFNVGKNLEESKELVRDLKLEKDKSQEQEPSPENNKNVKSKATSE